MNKKYNVLFVKDKKSTLDADSKLFNELFDTADKALNEEEALNLINANKYDILINDSIMDFLTGTAFVKHVKEMKSEQEVVLLVSPDNEGNLAEMVDLGIHVFLLTSPDFDQALEVISKMDLQ